MNHYFVDRKSSHGDLNGNVGTDSRNSLISGIKALFGDVETAPYDVTVVKEGYEERLYPPTRWVMTSQQGTEREAVSSSMYRKILNYMSGKNRQNVRLPMTTPLITLVDKATSSECSEFTMALPIPGESQMGPPDPCEGGIKVTKRPETVVYTRKFGGFANEETIAKEVKELTEILKKSCEDSDQIDFSRYYIATYDSGFKLIGRRNEVWFLRNGQPKA